MTDRQRPVGYRGALPERHDALARPWVVTVITIFLLMFVLAFVGFPSSVLPGASGAPSISLAPSGSGTAAPSPSSSAP
jgi:hypothetical protein